MYKIIRPFLFLFKDPEVPHTITLKFLKSVSKFGFITKILLWYCDVKDERLEQNIFGIDFKNPVCLAAGMDKNGECLPGFSSFGFGSLEIGTISRFPQDGNPRQRLFRLTKDKAVINRMGFNSVGSEAVARTLSKLKPIIPIGVSIGKTKVTPLNEAPADYVGSFETLFEYADYFVINVSSPNTPGLRELQEKTALRELIKTLQDSNDRMSKKFNSKRKPLLVKVSPDLTFEAIKELLTVCNEEKIDGIIAVNTTLSREGLSTDINQAGGLSGLPLKKKATEIISYIHKKYPKLPIIGVGGIFTAEDAYEKIKAGASLVQIYTSMVYEGPFVVRKINLGILKLLEKDKIKSLTELRNRF